MVKKCMIWIDGESSPLDVIEFINEMLEEHNLIIEEVKKDSNEYEINKLEEED